MFAVLAIWVACESEEAQYRTQPYCSSSGPECCEPAAYDCGCGFCHSFDCDGHCLDCPCGMVSSSTGPSCGPYLGPAACDACVAQECCSEELDCYLADACDDLLFCWSQCGGDAACSAGCRAAYPKAAGYALSSCLAAKCNSVCGFGGGGGGMGGAGGAGGGPVDAGADG